MGGDIRAGGAYIEITGRDAKLAAALRGARAKMKRFATDMTATGRSMMMAGAAVAAPILYGVREFAKFEDQMSEVATMLSGADMAFMPKFRKGVREMSIEFGQTTEALGSGLYDILSASIPAAQALDVLRASSVFATAGLTDTGTAADAITTILNSFQLGAKQATDVTDWFFAVVKRGKTRPAELANSIGMVASSAAVAGMSLEEMGAALATMTRAGVKTQRATTALNAIVMGFLKPTTDAAKAARSMGFELNSATLRAEGLAGVLKKLGRATPEQLAQMFPNIRALRGILPLLKNSAGFMYDLGLMSERAGLAAEALKKRQASLGYQLTRAKQAAAELFRTLGEAIKGPVAEAAKKFIETAKAVAAWIKRNKEVILALAKVAVAVFALGAALIALGLVIKVVLMLLSPAGLIALAVVGILLLLDALGIVDIGFWDFVNSIRIGSFKIATWLTAAWLIILQAWERVKNTIALGWDWLGVQIGNIGGGIYRTWLGVCKALAPVFWTAAATIAKGINWLIRKWNELTEGLGLGLAELDVSALSDMGDYSRGWYSRRIAESRKTQERRQQDFNKRLLARDKKTADNIAAYQKAVAKTFEADLDEQRRKRAKKDLAARRAGLAPATVPVGVALPLIGTAAGTGDIVGSFSAAVLRGSSPSIAEAKKHTKLLEQIRKATQATADKLGRKMVGHYAEG